jgi:hypothetical protein
MSICSPQIAYSDMTALIMNGIYYHYCYIFGPVKDFFLETLVVTTIKSRANKDFQIQCLQR